VTEQDEQQTVAPDATLKLQLVDRSVAVQDRSGADEERSLHEPVSRGIERRAGDPLRVEQPEAANQDPHVAHRREGEEPLEMALREAEQGAGDRGHRSEAEEDRA